MSNLVEDAPGAAVNSDADGEVFEVFQQDRRDLFRTTAAICVRLITNWPFTMPGSFMGGDRKVRSSGLFLAQPCGKYVTPDSSLLSCMPLLGEIQHLRNTARPAGPLPYSDRSRMGSLLCGCKTWSR